MTRGRPPQKGLDDAIPVARMRGAVLHFRQEEECAADFEILSADQIIIVRVKRTRRLHCSIQEIKEQFSEPILRLRSLPASAFLYRELWVWSQYGTWRFFRLLDTGIVEIDRDGRQLVVAVPGQGVLGSFRRAISFKIA